MRYQRRGVAVLVVAFAVCMLAACSAPPTQSETEATPTVTWHTAKTTSQALELRVVELLPPESVLQVEQADTGEVAVCNSREYRWLGVTTVSLAASTTPGEAVVFIEERLGEHEWTLVPDHDVLRNRRLVATDPKTATRILVRGDGEDGEIQIASTSPCFPSSNDVDPGPGY